MKILKSHLHSLVVVSLLVLGTACIKFHNVPSTAQLGTHFVSVRPQCAVTSTTKNDQIERDGTSRSAHYEFTCDTTAIVIRDNTLTINGKLYGTLKDGDAITMDHGKVRVNSVVRSEVR